MNNPVFKSGGLHEKHAVATCECWEPSQLSLTDTGKPRKTCADMTGRWTFRLLTSTQQSDKYSMQDSNTHTVTQYT